MIPDRGTYITRLLFFILLLAAVLRIYGLDRLGLWADELWVVMDSSEGSLHDMLLAVYYRDNHPPGYYLLSRYTQVLLGSSDFAIRLPSALTGILLVAATFMTGRKLFSPEAALIAAALVMGSYEAIYYSQEARANIFTALFSLLSLHYFLMLAMEGDLHLKNLIAFWFFAAVNAYFHYVGVVFTASLFFIYLFIIASRRFQDGLVPGLKIFFPVLLLYLPWLPGMYYDLVASPPEPWQYSPNTQTLVNTFIFLFGPGDIRVYIYGIVLTGVPLWIVAVMLVKPWRIRYGNNIKIVALIWFCILLPVVFFYLKSVYSQSAYNRRHFIYAIPFLSLLLGALLAHGLSYFAEKNKLKILVLAIVTIATYQILTNNNYALYRSNHFKQDYRESAKWVTEKINTLINNDTLIASNTLFFNHYLKSFSSGNLSILFLLDDVSKINSLSELISQQNPEKFYYLEAPATPAVNHMITDIDKSLAEQYQVICRKKFTRTQVILFSNRKPAITVLTDWKNVPDCTSDK